MTRLIAGLALAVSVLIATARPASATPFDLAAYPAAFTFTDNAALLQTRMTAAFDGTLYWTSSGGGASGNRLASYDAGGNQLNVYQPGLDFRSIFTDAAGNLYARQFASGVIYTQTSPGVFVPGVTLMGGGLDSQSSVVFNNTYTGYVAFNAGTVQEWNLAGNFLGSTPLIGFGSMFGENVYPQNRGIAVLGNHWLTYSNGNLSAWDSGGNRVDTAQLLGAGTSFDSHFSLGYANGMVFIVDQAGGQWRGYNVTQAPAAVPEPTSLLLFGSGAAALALLARRRRKSV